MPQRSGLFTWIVSRPRGTLAILAALVVISLFASATMPVTFLPQIELPIAVISTRFPGATAAEVEALVTIPIEDSLSSLEGLQSSEAMSRPGISVIVLDFDWGTDLVIAGVEVREAIDRVYPTLPSDLPRPQVYNVDPNDSPIGVVAVSPAPGQSLLEAREMAEREIRASLQKVEGVGFVTLSGGRRRRVEIRPDIDRLVASGLSFESLARLVGSSAVDVPAGSVFQGDRELVLRTVAAPRSVEELRLRTLPLPRGTANLDDLARVSWAGAPQQSLFMHGGEESLGLFLWPQTGTDPVDTMQRVRDEVRRLEQSYSSSLRLTVVSDRSTVIEQSIGSVLQAGLIGALVAALLVAAILRKVAASVVLVITLPVSIVLAMGALAATGAGINVVSLAGLSIGIGMLIDNAVVVVDNIQRMSKSSGDWPTRVAMATEQMTESIVGSTITTVVVFVPLLMLPGVLGAVFRELALAVAFALVASLLTSATLVPAAASMTPESWWFSEGGFRWQRLGTRIAGTAIRHRSAVIGVATVMLALVAVFLVTIPKTLFPPERSNEYVAEVSFPAGTTFETMRSETARVLSGVAFPEGVAVYAVAGGEPDDPFYGVAPEQRRENLSLHIILPGSASRYVQEATDSALEKLAAETGADVGPVAFGIDRVLDLPDASRWLIQSTTRESIEELAVRHRASNERELFPSATQPRIALRPIRDSLAQAGITAADLARTVQSAVIGTPAGSLESGGRRYGIVVLHEDSPGLSQDQVQSLPVTGAGGSIRPLASVADVEVEETSAALYRVDRQAALISDRRDPQTEATYQTTRLGAAQARRYTSETLLVLTISFVLLVLVLAAQFDSFAIPWLVVVTVPIAAFGAIIALVAAGRPLSINSGLGLLVLLGLVVNNAIVLYDTYRRRLSSGDGVHGALRRTVRMRLRPITVTSLSTIVALIPQTGLLGGTETQQDLAITVLGGILVSTLLTLYLIPSVLSFGRARSEGSQ